MKKYLILSLLLFGIALQAQTEAPKAPKAQKEADTSSAPGLLVGVGFLPNHSLYRVIDSASGERVPGYTNLPIRVNLMANKLYKGLGLFAALEFASSRSGLPFMDNSSDPNDPSTWANSYFRHMLGLTYSFGKFSAYAGMDMFSKNGFFRSVGEGGTIGSGRKTIGATYNAYKGLTVSVDFSAYAGPAVGVNYLIPLNGLK
jgi:hypothetical protein